MAVFGIDTSDHASQAAYNLAVQPPEGQTVPLIPSPPRFWGRYFNGTTGQHDSNWFQYNSSEHTILRQLGIPVLCFARQMWAVNDAAHAAAHAQRNMQGVVNAFGAQYLFNNNIRPMLYLDVEPETDNPASYILAQAYYTNWSAAIIAGISAGGHTITFRPAVYLNLKDNEMSFRNLNTARHAGAACEGVWPANYKYSDPNDMNLPYNQRTSPPVSYTHLTLPTIYSV